LVCEHILLFWSRGMLDPIQKRKGMVLQFTIIPPVRGRPCIRRYNAVHRYHTLATVVLLCVLFLHVDVCHHPGTMLVAVTGILAMEGALRSHDRCYAWF
jgi:hypothetical protein